VVDAIDHVILGRKWPWQPSAWWWRGFSPAARSSRGERLSSKAPGISFHIDGSSSKWISARELAWQPQATSALLVSRIPGMTNARGSDFRHAPEQGKAHAHLRLRQSAPLAAIARAISPASLDSMVASSLAAPISPHFAIAARWGGGLARPPERAIGPFYWVSAEVTEPRVIRQEGKGAALPIGAP
jgi:hypothetical protein